MNLFDLQTKASALRQGQIGEECPLQGVSSGQEEWFIYKQTCAQSLADGGASGMNQKPCLSGVVLIVDMLALLAGEKVIEKTRWEKPA